jgi:hypothetical protein
VTRRLLDFSDKLANIGFRSTLHRYQRRSVAAMIQKEMNLVDDPDPLFLPVNGMNEKRFFLQPGTTEVLLERPLVAPCRGGILCEELGMMYHFSIDNWAHLVPKAREKLS